MSVGDQSSLLDICSSPWLDKGDKHRSLLRISFFPTMAVWSLWFVTALSTKYNGQAWLNMSFIQVTWSQFCGWQKFTVSVLPLATISSSEKSEGNPKSGSQECPCCVPWLTTWDMLEQTARTVRSAPHHRCWGQLPCRDQLPLYIEAVNGGVL